MNKLGGATKRELEKIMNGEILKPTITTEFSGFKVLDLTMDGTAYCRKNNYISKTTDFVSFQNIYLPPTNVDYCFKLNNGAIFLVLVNGNIYLSDKNENNFQLLTDELGGQTHPTDTSRAFVYNNILLVGEYATPGTLGNKVFISTDFGKTFKISLLPGTFDDIIDHTHSIVYDPYEQLIWVAVGDRATTCRIFWSKDFGETWETHIDGQYRMTTIIPLPECVLFGTDEPKVIGTFKYDRVAGGPTPENFNAYLDFSYIYDENAYIFGWTTMASINFTSKPFAYIGSKMSHDYTPVGKGKIGLWRTDGTNNITIWEYDGINSKTPYGINSVHGPDKHGRVVMTWTNYQDVVGFTENVVVFK